MCAGPQLFRRLEPILVSRSVWTASGLPEFMSAGGDFVVSKRGDAVGHSSPTRMLMSFFGVLQRLPGMLVSRQVILLSLLFGHPMGMRRAVV
jgi:hypothetical protein